MGQKRAHVAATLNATGASRIFTQDVEDLPEFHRRAEPGVIEAEYTETPRPAAAPVTGGRPHIPQGSAGSPVDGAAARGQQPPADLDDVEAQFEELVPPRAEARPAGQPASRKFGQAHSLWQACLNKNLCSPSHEPAPDWDDEMCATFIANWTPELRKATGR